MKARKKLKVCYILSYKSPNYIRTHTLVEALKLMPEVELFEARNTSKGISRYFQTLWKLLKIRLKYHPDIYILGFRGDEIFPFVRILTLGRHLIIDEMMSPYDSLRYESKMGLIGKIVSIPVYIIEFIILHLSWKVLTDTKLHTEMFKHHFHLSDDKVQYVYVSTDEKVWNPDNYQNITPAEQFTVFNYSTFAPLHGVDVILQAANLTRDFPIKYILIGGKGKQLVKFHERMEQFNLSQNVEHHEWVEFEELANYSAGSSLCLGGPFGGTGQAQRVITGKTYQFICLGKPTVIGKIDEEFGFRDKENCLLIDQKNPEQLANAIMWAYNNKEKLESLGKKARSLYLHTFSNLIIAEQLKSIINE